MISVQIRSNHIESPALVQEWRMGNDRESGMVAAARRVFLHHERKNPEQLPGIRGQIMKKIICLDFDGVIHSYTSGWRGARNIPDPPVEGALEWMLEAIREHSYEIQVLSSRSRYIGGRWAMRRWLRGHCKWYEWYDTGFNMGGLELVKFVKRKPPAHVTIDDRGLTFSGKFPDLDDVAAFTPWNKKSGNATSPEPPPAYPEQPLGVVMSVKTGNITLAPVFQDWVPASKPQGRGTLHFSVPVADLKREVAEEYAEELKQGFLRHWAQCRRERAEP